MAVGAVAGPAARNSADRRSPNEGRDERYSSAAVRADSVTTVTFGASPSAPVAAALERLEGAKRLRDSGKESEALKGFDAALELVRDHRGTDIDRVSAWLLNAKALAYVRLAAPDAAIGTYDELLTRYGDSRDRELQEAVAYARYNRAQQLFESGRYSEAATAVGHMPGSNTVPPDLHYDILVLKQAVARQLGDVPALVAASEEAVTRFGETSDPVRRIQIAQMLVSQARALTDRGCPRDAIRVADELLARFGSISEPGIRAKLLLGLCAKGYALQIEGKKKDALVVFRAALRDFDDVCVEDAVEARNWLRSHIAWIEEQ